MPSSGPKKSTNMSASVLGAGDWRWSTTMVPKMRMVISSAATPPVAARAAKPGADDRA